jgi:hypothetical protein
MPDFQIEDSIDVRSAPRAAYDVVVGDILAASDDPDAITSHKVLDAGPVRPGFRWQQTLVHERHICSSDWIVTELEQGRALTQRRHHACAFSGRTSDSGEHWEFERIEDALTVVRLTVWRTLPGLGGWLVKALGPNPLGCHGVELRRRLNAVQFRAERTAQPGPT